MQRSFERKGSGFISGMFVAHIIFFFLSSLGGSSNGWAQYQVSQ